MKWIKWLALVILWVASIAFVYGLGGLAGMYAPKLAEKSMARAAKVLNVFSGEYKPCGDIDALECGYHDTAGRVEVDCADYQGAGAAVLMTFGQSNSANAGRDRYIPVGKVANFNFHDGKCYRAEDPLLGPDAPGGSVWGVLSDKLIAGGHYDKVLLVPFGIGGSAIAQWQTDGFLHPILQKATQAVAQKNITPTHVLWHQGEADAGSATSEKDYLAMFAALIESLRNYGIDAPVYPAIATHCEIPYFERQPHYQQGRQNVRAAQARLPELNGVLPGPDTDAIQGELYRHDNCHFNAKGMQAHAELWLQALTE